MKPFLRFALVAFALSLVPQLLFAVDLDGIDKETIYQEIDALVDSTPTIEEKQFKTSEKLIGKGIKQHDKGNYDKAITLYSKALKKNPLSALSHYELSMSYYAKRELREAYIATLKAIALDPGMEHAYIMQANILDDNGNPEAALTVYDRLLDINPNSFMALLNKGITFLKQEKFTAAESTFLQANEMHPSHPSPLYFLVVVNNMRGFSYDEEKFIGMYLEVAGTDHRRKIIESRREELSANAISITSGQELSTALLVAKVGRRSWRKEKHRTAYPNERGYRPSLKEERDVADLVLAMYDEQNEEQSFSASDIEKISTIKKLMENGFFEAKVYLDLQEYLGEDDHNWAQENKKILSDFESWAEEKTFTWRFD